MRKKQGEISWKSSGVEGRLTRKSWMLYIIVIHNSPDESVSRYSLGASWQNQRLGECRESIGY